MTLPREPQRSWNGRACSRAGALLNCRALESQQRWRSLSACTAQGWVGAVSSMQACESQVALAHPATTELGQGTGARLLTVPCHRNALPTCIALADLTRPRPGSLFGSAPVTEEPWRRTLLFLSPTATSDQTLPDKCEQKRGALECLSTEGL